MLHIREVSAMLAVLGAPPALRLVSPMGLATTGGNGCVEKNGIEYVLRLGSRIADERGKPIPSWSDWSVSYISEGIVLFSDGKSDMSARERVAGQ